MDNINRGIYKKSVWKWVYLLRGFLVSVPLVFAVFLSCFEVENEYLTWSLGLSVFFVGMAIRIWTQQHLRYRLKVSRQLAVTGPYQFVRNPVYIGNALIFSGMIIMMELVWLVPVALVWSVIVYSFVICYEEMHLLQRYGESYQKYMSEVPRWLPSSLRLRDLGVKTENFAASIVAELHCLLFLLPCIFKEVTSILIEY
jgi:protein-S-isoprenylcysteine O-methyltransferase Ste14